MPLRIPVLVILAILLFFTFLGSTSLWDPDEPRQAIMAREMMERGDYVHPYLNGKPYLEKPPLYPWAIILVSNLRGSVDELSSRIPSAIAATLLVFATYFFGSMLAGVQGGFIAALILMTNYQFLGNARESTMDMTFALFMGLTIFFSYWAQSKERRLLFVFSFLPASLAILAKGPAGLVIPAAVIFVCLIIEGRLKRFIVPLAVGCLVSAALASIWFIVAGQEYINEFIFHQNITRYTKAFDHRESLFYYFHKLFFNFLPWSVFLPFALFHAWKKKYWLPFVWFITIFLFFELSQSKRAIYLLSLYPACALLCGLYLKDRWEWLVNNIGTGFALKIYFIILAIFPIAGILALPYLPSTDVIEAIRNASSSLYVYLVLLLIVSVVALVMLFKKLHKSALVFFVLYFVIVAFFHNAYYLPVTDKASKSLRLITDKLEPYIKTKEIYTLGFDSPGIIFYAGKPVQKTVALEEIVKRKDDILLIVEEGNTGHLKNSLEESFRQVDRVKFENDYYTFYVRKHG